MRHRYSALPRAYWFPAVMIAVLALSAAFIRAIAPLFDFDVRIDTTTVALLGIAFLPFLVPLVRTLELGTSGLKADLAEIQQEVEIKAELSEAELNAQTQTASPDVIQLVERALEVGRLHGISESLSAANAAYSSVSGTISPTPFTDYLMKDAIHWDRSASSPNRAAGAADANDPYNHFR